MGKSTTGKGTDGKALIRCAIYTRKSSEDGLEQDFDSLDAQRESCEAFIPGFPRWIASLMTFLGGSAIRINAIPSSRRVKPVSPCG